MDTRRFHKELFDTARRLISADATVVCAVSGGPDSMALLHGLHAINRMRNCGWSLHVAHLDHRLPHDSTAMMEFVRQTADSLQLSCTTGTADVPALSRETGESVEEAGRKARYAFLEKVARLADAKFVALAHHADDQAETVLHRILRGTGLRGLAGMSLRRPIREGSSIVMVRPLLSMRRKDLQAYLQRRGLPSMHDATNEDVHAATRNRIRHILLPQIEGSINPEVVTALVRLAKQADRASEAMRRWSRDAFEELRLETTENGLSLDAAALADLPRAVQTEIIRGALEDLGAGFKKIGFERIEAAADAALGDGALRRIELPDGIAVERRGRTLRFIRIDRDATVRPERSEAAEGSGP